MVEGTRLNGLAVRSWGDVAAVATLLALQLGVLSWGLKLEAELNTLRDLTNSRLQIVTRDVAVLTSRVDTGILPRAEERIERQSERHMRDIASVQRRLDRLEETRQGAANPFER